MPSSNNTQSKPIKKKTLDPTIAKERREAIEKRIARLETKLNKDRLLLLRYAEQELPTEESGSVETSS